MCFAVPDRPMVGGGCCAIASAQLVEEELGRLAGVEYVHGDDERRQVTVVFDPEGLSVEELREALSTLGFLPDD